MAGEVTIEIKNIWIIGLIILLGIVFVIELQVSLSSPIVFGDEGFHTRMAQWIAQEQEYPKYIPFVGFDLSRAGYYREPLWNFLVGSFFFLFGFNDVFVKILTPFISSLLSGLMIYILVKRIYDKKIGFLASIISITVPSVVTYALLVYVDSLFLFYFSAFAFTLILALEEDRKKYYFLAGSFGALAFLTKLTGTIVPLIVFLIFLYQLLVEKKSLGIWKKYLWLALPFIVVGAFLLRNIVTYGAPCGLPFIPGLFGKGKCEIDEYVSKYQFAGRTEQTGTEQSVFAIGIATYLDFAYGNLWLVIFGLAAGLFLLIKDLNRKNFVILVMLAFLVFLMTRSEVNYRAEDASRYVLGFVPIVVVVSSIFFANFYDFLEKNYKYLGLVIVAFILFLSYLNFSGKVTTIGPMKQAWSSFIDDCNWIKANVPEDSKIMTVWVWHTAYNCQRNVVGNLADLEMSQDLNFSLLTIKNTRITHIFIQKYSLSSEYLTEKYNINFVKFLEDNPKCFNKIHETGLALQQCVQQGGCDGSILYEIDKECLK